jgi:uncharacterized protein involved in exopolysaccharide biosynthesis
VSPDDDVLIGSATLSVTSAHPYIRLAKRYRFLLVGVLVASVLFTGARILLQEPIYMAKATILPSGGQGGAGVLGLIASVTGAPPILGASEENSSMLFPRIVKSRRVSLEVVHTKFPVASRGGTEMTLQQYFEAASDDEALLALETIYAVDVDKETGMISVSVSTPDPDLSARIANRFVEVLERVNGEIRRASAAQNSDFLQERLAEMQAELTQSEDRLTRFREENVRVNAPELELERLRLEREVALKSQIFVSLSSQAELARFEEAKNLPIVRVLERATTPTLPIPVPRLALLVGACLAGLVIGGALVAGIEILRFLRAASAAN